ncbi:RNA binding protein [Klebsormidium nitens]|uniref:RNA binding protein n=1 Tax=Klebsormidium nitens TaxID=105231 RepID=A0A1Y1I0X7_KLENI|nr:RNA binding protein [Klebsormidium nitens]|eukprot:GAQ83612.1 RNA binding protein [Klebsormidium nitens]
MEEVFRCVGAVAVRASNVEGKLRGVVFVDFRDAGVAARAKDQLHGLKILNKTLAADFARPQSVPQPPPPKPPPDPATSGARAPAESLSKLPSGSISGTQMAPPHGPSVRAPPPESIASALNLDYPFPPHLRYRYPPPDAGVLGNIQAALISVPRFYTQVLHLMNKMNLPPPFASVFPPPPSQPTPAPAPKPVVPAPPTSIHADVSKGIPSGPAAVAMPPQYLAAAPVPPSTETAHLPPNERPANVSGSGESKSESESELESEEDGEVPQTALGKRKKDRPVEHRKKRRRSSGATGTFETAGVRDVPLEAAGPREVRPQVKKATMQIKLDVSSIKARTAKLPVPRVVKPSANPPSSISAAPDSIEAAQPAPARREELKAGQAPQEDLLANPAFKNYAPGEATPVLYVKNIAKDVTVTDMQHVFGGFLSAGDTAAGAIRLMQEGRMKGQAFVTLPDALLAEEAMGYTHGYLLKGKPLIVQYGRKPKAK